jgi:cyclase
VNRTVIIARIAPGTEQAVADVFRRSDQTEMPHRIGVAERNLYVFHDLYAHIIDFTRPPAEAMRIAQSMDEFRRISDDLAGYISPYDPNWRTPADAVARPFYTWSASDVPATS